MFIVMRKHRTGPIFLSFADALDQIKTVSSKDLEGCSYSVKRIAASHFAVYRSHPLLSRGPQTFEECENAIIAYQRMGMDGDYEIVMAN